MRTSMLALAALAALASPAFAQDRTLPAGAYMSAQPPIDNGPVASVGQTIEGRSVGPNAAPVVRKRVHHSY